MHGPNNFAFIDGANLHFTYENLDWELDYAKLRNYLNEQFAHLMLEDAGVALLPGTNFGEHAEGYVRLSYATSPEIIEEGIEQMRKVLQGRRN